MEHMKHMHIKNIVLVVTALLAAWTCSTQAGLDGSLVNLSVYAPDTSTLYAAGANKTVSAAIEYPLYGGPQANGIAIDINDTQMIINWKGGYSFYLYDLSFNGYLLKILSGPNILSAVTDPVSTINPTGIWIEGGNKLFVNMGGLMLLPAGGTAVIDITTSVVPEPSTYLAGLSALGLLGFFGVRNRK
jgi:hypothetical protein